MTTNQTSSASSLPDLWLLSDARNDAMLEQAIAALPRGSGFIFRHYHLEESLRHTRYTALVPALRKGDHCVILSGTAELAREWGADGIYGVYDYLADADDLLRFTTAHNAGEIELANEASADAVLISPVFATTSHPDTPKLGAENFRALVALTEMPAIALGGMTRARAEELDWPRWAAIDGLS